MGNTLRILFQYAQKNMATLTSVCFCRSKYKYKIMAFILSLELFNKGQVQVEKLKYWILFPLKSGKLTHALRDQVTQCSGSLTFSTVSMTSTNDDCTTRGKKLWTYTIPRVHNIAHMNCRTCTYFFPKLTISNTSNTDFTDIPGCEKIMPQYNI